MEEITDSGNPPKPAYAANLRNPFLLAAAVGDNSPFRYIGGTLIIFGAFFMGQIPLTLVLMVFGMMNEIPLEQLSDTNALLAAGFDKTALLFLYILSFMIGILAIWLVIRFMHRRNFLTLITPLKKLNWKKLFTAFFIYFLLSGCFEIALYMQDTDNYVFQFEPVRFFILTAVVLVFLPFQTSFEELVFRGYLLQGFSFMFRSSVPALILTSILFALLHSWNPEVKQHGFWVMFPYYCGFGLLLGFITLKDKGMEIALAVHAANNIFSSLFVTFESSALQTDALFMQKEMNPAKMMPLYFLSMFLFLLICSFVFGWWKKKTIENIPENEI